MLVQIARERNNPSFMALNEKQIKHAVIELITQFVYHTPHSGEIRHLGRSVHDCLLCPDTPHCEQVGFRLLVDICFSPLDWIRLRFGLPRFGW